MGSSSELAGFNDPTLLDQSINASTNVHTRDNHFGGIYSFNYDVLHSTMLQQRIVGVLQRAVLRPRVRVPDLQLRRALASSPIPADHRFFLSFTLAGLGNFSPFNGALSGVPR